MYADASGVEHASYECARQQRNSKPGANTAEDRFECPELQLTLDDDATTREEGFKHLSVGTAGAQHHRSRDASLENRVQGRDVWGRQNHKLLPKHHLLFKCGMGYGAAYKSSVELLLRYRRD